MQVRTGARRRLGAVATTVMLAPLLASCAGQSCDRLPQVLAQRDQARADYLALVRSGASNAETERADGELHIIEQRAYKLEQACD